LLVIPPDHNDIRVVSLKLDDSLDNTRSVFASVDEVAQEDDLIGPDVPRHIGNELVQERGPPVNVADDIC